MRLLYLYDLPLGAPVAAPLQILKTGRALAELGVDVTTGWASVPPDSQWQAQYGISPHERLKAETFFTRLTRWRLRARLRDVVPAFDIVMSRGETGVRVFQALRHLPQRPPFVFEVHRRAQAIGGLFHGLSPSAATRLEREAIRGADGLAFISNGIQRAMRESHGFEVPDVVLPSGVDVDSDPPATERNLDLIYAGKLEQRKGIDLLLEAMQYIDANLTLIGGSTQEVATCKAKAQQAGVENRLNALGYVPPGQVRPYFRRARVGLCPLPAGTSEVSEHFTSPMKIMEMMACRTPIVASDVPSVREILSHEVNALLVPPNDAKALAAAASRLLSDPALARRLADRAAEDVLQYTWPARADRLLKLLHTVIGRHAV